MEYRRHLPHFHPHSAYVFLTWRLWGSLPTPSERAGAYLSPGHAFVAIDRALDRYSSGSRWLEQAPIADLIAEAIEVGDRERHFYELPAWALMPNHVHLLILPKVPVPVIMRWLKGSTARKANLVLRRTGQHFWQDESFDHWVRNNTEFGHIVQYIEESPVAAGLVSSAETVAVVERRLEGETACLGQGLPCPKTGGTACPTQHPEGVNRYYLSQNVEHSPVADIE